MWIVIYIFDNSASHALSPESSNVNKVTLNDIAEGLKCENPYCMELHQLGLSVQQGVLSASINIIPRMVNQSAFRTIYVVTNCRETGVTTLNVTTTNASILEVKMNSEKVEPLCFPLLFLHREAGYTNDQKDHISPSQYVMVRMLRPEKIYGQWMTAPARHLDNPQIIDRCTAEPFESDEDIESGETAPHYHTPTSVSKMIHADEYLGSILVTGNNGYRWTHTGSYQQKL